MDRYRLVYPSPMCYLKSKRIKILVRADSTTPILLIIM